MSNAARNNLSRTVAIRRLFSARMVWGEVRRATTDPTPHVVGAAEWGGRKYMRAAAEELMATFVAEGGRREGIADKELAGLAIGRLAGFPGQSDAVLVAGVDNKSAVCWLVKGRSRSKFARNFLSTFLFWWVKHGSGGVIFYLENIHIITDGDVAKMGDGGSPRGEIARGSHERLRRINGVRFVNSFNTWRGIGFGHRDRLWI